METLQYVQPVQVIPVGSPVPAVAVGNQPYIPTQTVYTANNNRASYDGPATSYSPPRPSYSAPRPSYVPKTSYNPPPKPAYNAPNPGYNAPSSSYGAPSSSYGAPGSSYGVPTTTYSAPSSSYGAPTTSYGAPSTTYGVPSFLSTSGSSNYITAKQTGLTYQTGFIDEYSETLRPTREGRLEECYCVQAAQCPAGQVVGNAVKDYSALINPRVKNTELNITAADEEQLEEENDTQQRQGSRWAAANLAKFHYIFGLQLCSTCVTVHVGTAQGNFLF